MSVPGVGPVTAVAFIATLDDPKRFHGPKQVRAYLGLVPREYSSGEKALRGRIASIPDGPMLLEGNMTMSNRNWTVGCKPTRYSGIYKTTSGYRVRVRAVDPRTGTQREANQSFDGITMEQAVLKQAQLRDAIRIGGGAAERTRVMYVHYVKSLFERKLAMGELRSAKTRERWADTQDLHLIPYFGDWYVDAIRKPDIEEWKAAQGRKIEGKKYSPNTANGWLAILLTTLRAAVEDLEL